MHSVHHCLRKSVRGGLIIVGEINLGGSIEPVHNAVSIAEMAVEKGAAALLMPVTCRRQLLTFLTIWLRRSIYSFIQMRVMAF